MFQMLHFTELARIFWMVAKSLFRGCSRVKSWSLDMALVPFKQSSSLHMISLNHKLLPFIAKELIFTQKLVKQKAEGHFQSVWLRGRAVINMTAAASLAGPGSAPAEKCLISQHSCSSLKRSAEHLDLTETEMEETPTHKLKLHSQTFCKILRHNLAWQKVCRGEKGKAHFNSWWSVCKDYRGFLLLWYQLSFFNVFSISSSIIWQCFHVFILWKNVSNHIFRLLSLLLSIMVIEEISNIFKETVHPQ